MGRRVVALFTLFTSLYLVGCGDTIIHNQLPTSPTNPTTPVVTSKRVDFRVVGNPTSVRVRFTNTVDGLAQVTTSLPYNVSFNTTAQSMFLSIEATPLTYPIIITNPFLAVQIYVNNELFREASSNDLTFSTVSASGIWRQ